MTLPPHEFNLNEHHRKRLASLKHRIALFQQEVGGIVKGSSNYMFESDPLKMLIYLTEEAVTNQWYKLPPTYNGGAIMYDSCTEMELSPLQRHKLEKILESLKQLQAEVILGIEPEEDKFE